MLFRNHLVVTSAIAVLADRFILPHMQIEPLVAIGCIFIGSLLPDLDHPESTIGKKLLFISIPLSAVFGHRQITHSIWSLVAFWMLFEAQGEYALMLMIGYISHLLADVVTDSGIPFFWPLQTRIRLPLGITTGGIVEYCVAYSALVCSIIYAQPL